MSYRRPTRKRYHLHSHAFGEVAWFIDVAAELACEVIGEKLKRDDSQDGA
jgi:hypothetical protein